MTKYGTPAIASLTNEAGVFPTRYWKKSSFEFFEDINAMLVQSLVEK